MIYLVKRNLLLYFRDKANVFFSLLSVLIIIGLYLLFLGDAMKRDFQELDDIGQLIDSWIMAGVIAVTPITTALSALGSIVEDRKLNIYKDFSASPIKRSSLAAGYIISSFLISVIMTLITLILAELYIMINGGQFLSLTALVEIVGFILIYNLSSIFALYYLVSFFNSSNAFSTFTTVFGTLIGFITGIYIPIGSLPDWIQFFVKIFPPSHAAMLLRQVMMGPIEQTVFASASNTVIQDFQLSMGSVFKFGDFTIQWWTSILYLLVVGMLSFLLSIWKMSSKKK